MSSSSLEGRANVSKPDATQTWDPGGAKGDNLVRPNEHVMRHIICAINTNAIKADDDDDMSISSQVETRTELDSHANMAVVGKHTCVLRDTGQRVNVNPFSPDFSALQDAKVVDAVKSRKES